MIRELSELEVVPAALVEDLSLAATELITNAVNAGAASVRAVLSIQPSHVELLVDDDGPGTPNMRDFEQLSTSGRGLRIIDEISVDWGFRHSGAGKTVWARFA